MDRELRYYKSVYFKSKPLNERLILRFNRFMHKLHCKLDSLVTGKFKYGWRYNGKGTSEKQ